MAFFSLVTHVVFIFLGKKPSGTVSKILPYPCLGRLPYAQVCQNASAGAESFQHLPQPPPTNRRDCPIHWLFFHQNFQIYFLCPSGFCFFLCLPVFLVNNSWIIFLGFPPCISRILTLKSQEMCLRGLQGCALGPRVSEIQRQHNINWLGFFVVILVFYFYIFQRKQISYLFPLGK